MRVYAVNELIDGVNELLIVQDHLISGTKWTYTLDVQ